MPQSEHDHDNTILRPPSNYLLFIHIIIITAKTRVVNRPEPPTFLLDLKQISERASTVTGNGHPRFCHFLGLCARRQGPAWLL